MKDNNYLTQARALLSDGMLGDCIDLLKENIKDEGILHQVLQLEIRHSQLQRKISGGVIDSDDAQLEENRISNALLLITTNLAKGRKVGVGSNAAKSNNGTVRWLVIGIIALALVGLGGYFISKSGEGKPPVAATDPCENVRCLNGGQCNQGKCVCPSGFTGTYCETKVAPADPCAKINCLNGGTCQNGSCNCPAGYTGSRCETRVAPADPCASVNCLNGGKCQNGKCDCPSGYTGSRCETKVVPASPATSEDCISFDLAAITVRKQGSSYFVTDGRSRMMSFTTEKAARQAVATIKKYKLNKQCFATRPKPGLQYFLSGSSIPSGKMTGEDCLPISSPNNLKIQQRGDIFSIVDTGNRGTPYSAKSREEAERIIAIVKKYKAKYNCFIARPNPGMTYLRK